MKDAAMVGYLSIQIWSYQRTCVSRHGFCVIYFRIVEVPTLKSVLAPVSSNCCMNQLSILVRGFVEQPPVMLYLYSIYVLCMCSGIPTFSCFGVP